MIVDSMCLRGKAHPVYPAACVCSADDTRAQMETRNALLYWVPRTHRVGRSATAPTALDMGSLPRHEIRRGLAG